MSLSADSTPLSPTSRADTFVIPRQDIPTTPTDIMTKDCWIREIVIVNTGNVNATVTVVDKQSPAKTYINQLLYPGSRIDGESSFGRYMPGGITWSSTQPNVHAEIVGQIWGPLH
jgi:hypothetical protein